jgi:2-C-methyl-D-erythritol 4-phosphate cytidylyltransferase
VLLAGRPMVEWSLAAFAAADSVGPVIVALPPGHELELGQDAIQVVGGEHRSESVAAGLGRVETEVVAVHDAARPLVTAELIDDLVAELAARPDAAGVIAATPLTDTVKRAYEPRRPEGGVAVDASTVAETVDRDRLWAAQTPQVFRTAALLEALASDPERVAAATDEAMIVERAGRTVLIHPSGPENLKVTTPLDLRVAELLLAERPDPG